MTDEQIKAVLKIVDDEHSRAFINQPVGVLSVSSLLPIRDAIKSRIERELTPDEDPSGANATTNEGESDE